MVWSLLVLGACYAPSPKPGAPCSVNGECPSGLVCTTGGTCELAEPDVDASIDDLDAGSVICTGTFSVCVDGQRVPGNRMLEDVALDTDDDAQCDVIVDDVCVIHGRKLTISGSVRATGRRPLVLLGLTEVQLAAAAFVDVASTSARIGAGSDPAICSAGGEPSGASGGAGGSFGTTGGAGGVGRLGTLGGTPAIAAPRPDILRGGCRGGAGGGNPDASRGRGGGAVYVVARDLVAVAGTINASGAGGAGCALGSDCGGGGGGSGGMIALDAAQIVVTTAARVFANGGGGGEGTGGVSSSRPGQDPTSPDVPAAGGQGNALAGGDGGDGYAGTLAARDGMDSSSQEAGGGGGGGGAGVVLVIGERSVTGLVSPPPQ